MLLYFICASDESRLPVNLVKCTYGHLISSFLLVDIAMHLGSLSFSFLVFLYPSLAHTYSQKATKFESWFLAFFSLKLVMLIAWNGVWLAVLKDFVTSSDCIIGKFLLFDLISFVLYTCVFRLRFAFWARSHAGQETDKMFKATCGIMWALLGTKIKKKFFHFLCLY